MLAFFVNCLRNCSLPIALVYTDLIFRSIFLALNIAMPSEKGKKIFPIQTKTGCLLKWNWSTIYLQSGTSASCHRTTKLKIPEDNFDSFHNLPKKIEDRERMLQGEWPIDTCGYCRKMEEAGGFSDRMNQLAQQTDPDHNPPELKANPTAVEVTPTILQVFFKNTCNMSCVYCGPHLSSKWETEIEKHGQLKSINVSKYSTMAVQNNPNYDRQKKDLWKYLKEKDRYKNIRIYSVLGGEPLVIPELYESLDFWEKHPNDKLVFEFTTNLKATDKRIEALLSRMQKMIDTGAVLRFKIVASIDALGPEQEYARYGMDLEQFIMNFEKLSRTKGIELAINSTLSALTIKKLPDLIKKIEQWNAARSGDRIVFSFNTDEDATNPKIFGPGVFDQELEETMRLLPEKNVREIIVKRHFQTVAHSIMSAKRQPEKINTMKRYLTELDARRNTDWRKVYPWLQDV